MAIRTIIECVRNIGDGGGSRKSSLHNSCKIPTSTIDITGRKEGKGGGAMTNNQITSAIHEQYICKFILSVPNTHVQHV